MDEPVTLKSVIGKELFSSIINTLALEVDENHCIALNGHTLRLNSDGNLVFGQKQKQENENEKSDKVPAIYKILRDRKDKKVYEIKAHPMVSKLFEMKQHKSIKFAVTEVPMYVPPLPWSSTKVGLL